MNSVVYIEYLINWHTYSQWYKNIFPLFVRDYEFNGNNFIFFPVTKYIDNSLARHVSRVFPKTVVSQCNFSYGNVSIKKFKPDSRTVRTLLLLSPHSTRYGLEVSQKKMRKSKLEVTADYAVRANC